MDSIRLSDLRQKERSKIERIIEVVEREPLAYRQFHGEQLHADRDIVKVPAGGGGGENYRLLFLRREGRLHMRAILTHADFNKISNNKQAAFLDRLKNGTNLAAPAESLQQVHLPPEPSVSAPEPVQEETIVTQKPVARIFKDWLRDRVIGSIFSMEDFLQSRPALRDDKSKRGAIYQAFLDAKIKKWIEETDNKLGTTLHPITTYRLLAHPPEAVETETTATRVLKWAKTQVPGSHFTLPEIARVMGFATASPEYFNTRDCIKRWAKHKLVLMCGHKPTTNGKLSPEYKFLSALYDYEPTVGPTRGPTKRVEASPASEPAQTSGARKPQQILANIKRELAALADAIDELKVEKHEKPKKLTDYSAKDLLDALVKVQRKEAKA